MHKSAPEPKQIKLLLGANYISYYELLHLCFESLVKENKKEFPKP